MMPPLSDTPDTNSLPDLNGRLPDAGEAVLHTRADVGVAILEQFHQEAETVGDGGLRR